MDIWEGLERLPAGSPIRTVIVRLASQDQEIREQARRKVQTLPALTRREAAVILEIGTRCKFPAEPSWNDCGGKLLQLLWQNPFPSLLPRARAVYGAARDEAKKVLLAYFGATKCKAGAETLVRCVRKHGWPPNVSERVFREMENLIDYSDALFPELLAHAGPFIVSVGDVALGALKLGKLSAAKLQPIEPFISERLTRSLDLVEPFQQSTGVAWRFAEEYRSPRQHAGLFLDFAGWLPEPRTGKLIERGPLRFIRRKSASLEVVAVGGGDVDFSRHGSGVQCTDKSARR